MNLCKNYCKKNATDVGLFLLRLALALVFIYHGATKFTDMPGTVNFFTQMLHLPSFLATLIPIAEILSGLAMLVGCFTCIAAGVQVVILLGAIYFAHPLNIYGMMKGGYEYELTLLFVAIAVAHLGTGRFALCMKKNPPTEAEVGTSSNIPSGGT